MQINAGGRDALIIIVMQIKHVLLHVACDTVFLPLSLVLIYCLPLSTFLSFFRHVITMSVAVVCEYERALGMGESITKDADYIISWQQE